jgi:hypothetical protein
MLSIDRTATPAAQRALGPLSRPAWLATCTGPSITLGSLQDWLQAHGLRMTCRLRNPQVFPRK